MPIEKSDHALEILTIVLRFKLRIGSLSIQKPLKYIWLTFKTDRLPVPTQNARTRNRFVKALYLSLLENTDLSINAI